MSKAVVRMTLEEEWRRIAWAPQWFVSSYGRVLGVRGRVLKGRPRKNGGYLAVQIAGVDCYVHDLVAEAFIGPKPFGLQTRHLDTDATNNSVQNLAYGTPKDNAADGIRTGKQHRGERTGGSLMTADQVGELRKLYASGGVSQSELARRYGIKQPTVNQIVNLRSWKHVESGS
jgi:hypothetical protein